MRRPLTLDFLRTEAASGAVLAGAALLALLMANSPLRPAYSDIIGQIIPVQIGDWREALSLADWVKEGLMALFFFVVGLDLKYEVLRGELSNPRKLALPILSAVGGMAVPAGVYLTVAAISHADLRGWSTPMATDIAFALAALALAGRGLAPSLRVFLLTLAVVDDLGAVVVIALAYTRELHIGALAAAAGVLAVTAALSRDRRAPLFLYLLAFAAVWALVLHSGISTSVAGVAAALAVPIDARRPGETGVLRRLVDRLHPYVAFGVLPLFAFTSAGFVLVGEKAAGGSDALSVAIGLGLVLGKPAGVIAAAALAVGAGLARKPTGATWLELTGVACLCGVGFTMSLFLATLAFHDAPPEVMDAVKRGVAAGSLISVLLGALVLSAAARLRRRASLSRSGYA